MKKNIVFILVALFLLAIPSLSFATVCDNRGGTNYFNVEGKILSIDKDKRLLIVKDANDGKNYHFMVWPSDLASLSEGDDVTVFTEHSGAVRQIK